MIGLVMLRTMNPIERVSWLAWSWGLFFVSLRRSRQSRRKEHLRSARKDRKPLPPQADVAA